MAELLEAVRKRNVRYSRSEILENVSQAARTDAHHRAYQDLSGRTGDCVASRARLNRPDDR